MSDMVIENVHFESLMRIRDDVVKVRSKAEGRAWLAARPWFVADHYRFRPLRPGDEETVRTEERDAR